MAEVPFESGLPPLHAVVGICGPPGSDWALVYAEAKTVSTSAGTRENQVRVEWTGRLWGGGQPSKSNLRIMSRGSTINIPHQSLRHAGIVAAQMMQMIMMSLAVSQNITPSPNPAPLGALNG